MHPRPRLLLQQLIQQHGPGLAQDPRRVEGFLADLCGQHEREIFVLVHAQKVGIPGELRRAGRMAGDAAHWQRLSRRLQDRLAFTPEAADWAVESWALALGIRPARPLPQHLARRAGDLFLGLLPEQIRLPRLAGPRLWAAGGVALLTLLLILAVPPLRQAFSQLSAPPGEPPHAEIPSPSELRSLVERGLPMPQSMRLEGDLIPVRDDPDPDAAVIGQLRPPGAVLLATAVSGDGAWLRIGEPIDGWVPAGEVSFSVDEAGRFDLRLRPGLAQVTVDGLRVRAAPSTAAAVAETLYTGEVVALLGESLDGTWYHILDPYTGWISGVYVDLIE